MVVAGETIYIASKCGKKQDGTDWFNLKFLDEDADEFFVVFVDENIFQRFQTVPKRTGVMLTINIVPGSKFFTLENVEIM
jgi:hypothetical protein